MASLLREMFDWIEGQAGLTAALDWHCAELPPEALNTCAALIQRGGEASKPKLRGSVGAYLFQVLARGEPNTNATAQDMADAIHGVLSDRAGIILNDWEVCVVESVSEPQFLGHDARARPEYAANYVVRAFNRAAWAAV